MAREVIPDLSRLAMNQILGLGYVPENYVLLIFCEGEVTLCCTIKDGRLDIEVDAPVLQ